MSTSSNPHKEHDQMLFDENLGIAKNEVEFEKLLKQFPEYDPLFVWLPELNSKRKDNGPGQGTLKFYTRHND